MKTEKTMPFVAFKAFCEMGYLDLRGFSGIKVGDVDLIKERMGFAGLCQVIETATGQVFNIRFTLVEDSPAVVTLTPTPPSDGVRIAARNTARQKAIELLERLLAHAKDEDFGIGDWWEIADAERERVERLVRRLQELAQDLGIA